MTAGDDTLSGLPNFCCTDAEFGGSRIRICIAWVRQRVLSVRTKVCSSRVLGTLSGFNTRLGKIQGNGGTASDELVIVICQGDLRE